MKEIIIQLNVVNPFSIQFQTMGMMVNLFLKNIFLDFFFLVYLDGTITIITCSRTIYFND